MAMNPLYDPNASGSGSSDFGPKAEAWWPKTDGDKIRGTITFIGEPWDKPKDPKWVKEGDPEWKKVVKTQKVVIGVDGKEYAIYLSGRLFKAIGVAMAEHGLDDFGSNVYGWGLGYKWNGFDVDDKGKPYKKFEFKFFPPAN